MPGAGVTRRVPRRAAGAAAVTGAEAAAAAQPGTSVPGALTVDRAAPPTAQVPTHAQPSRGRVSQPSAGPQFAALGAHGVPTGLACSSQACGLFLLFLSACVRPVQLGGRPEAAKELAGVLAAAAPADAAPVLLSAASAMALGKVERPPRRAARAGLPSDAAGTPGGLRLWMQPNSARAPFTLGLLWWLMERWKPSFPVCTSTPAAPRVRQPASAVPGWPPLRLRRPWTRTASSRPFARARAAAPPARRLPPRRWHPRSCAHRRAGFFRV
jgi:hypothetical protein